MSVLLVLISSVAGLAWVSAAVHAIILVQHRRPDVTVGQLVFGGHRFFSAQTFTEAGRASHRRFLISVGLFAGCLLAGMGVGALAAVSAP